MEMEEEESSHQEWGRIRPNFQYLLPDKPVVGDAPARGNEPVVGNEQCENTRDSKNSVFLFLNSNFYSKKTLQRKMLRIAHNNYNCIINK